MKKRIGYVVQSGSESLKDTLQWYSLESLPNNKGALKDDIQQTFQNINPKTAQVYEVLLVPVGRKIPRPART